MQLKLAQRGKFWLQITLGTKVSPKQNQRTWPWPELECWNPLGSEGPSVQEDLVLKPLYYTLPKMSRFKALWGKPACQSFCSPACRPRTPKILTQPQIAQTDLSPASCLLAGWPCNKAFSFLEAHAIVLASVCMGQWALCSVTQL